MAAVPEFIGLDMDAQTFTQHVEEIDTQIEKVPTLDQPEYEGPCVPRPKWGEVRPKAERAHLRTYKNY